MRPFVYQHELAFGKESTEHGLHTVGGAPEDGTGLGLPFCRRIMRAFDGDIIYRSEMGKWTEFEMRFPNINIQHLIQNKAFYFPYLRK